MILFTFHSAMVRLELDKENDVPKDLMTDGGEESTKDNTRQSKSQASKTSNFNIMRLFN